PGFTAADFQTQPPTVEEPRTPEASPETSEPQFLTLMTGEVVEAPDSPIPAKDNVAAAAKIGNAEIAAEPSAPIFVLSFCKACGFQNPEGVMECIKCKSMLEVVAEPPGDVEALPRAWGFDVLGLAWIILGFGAIFS